MPLVLVKSRVTSVIAAVLIAAGFVGIAFAAGAYASGSATRSATRFTPHSEVRPAHHLRMIAKSLDLQCRRSPNRTATMDREDVERVYSLALQAYSEEQARLAQPRRTRR